jgi:tetratricopeptide (TPR) repeat protein
VADVANGRALFVVLVSLWAGGGTRAAENAQIDLPIRPALERYAVDAGGSVASEISKRREFPLILSRYSDEAERWVGASNGAERTRRERLAVGFAMELLAAAVEGSIQSYESGRGLIEWACRLLAKGPPTEFERAVHLTSVAILQGVGDYLSLGIDEVQNKRAGHLDHALARYPDEDRLKLARVLSRYELRVITTTRMEPSELVPSTRYRPPGDGAKRLGETFDLLSALDGPLVKDEAVLRRGVLQLLAGKLAGASQDLGAASQSPDPFVAYIANLMLGSMYDSSGQTEAAVGRYAKASSLVPASSARLALAAALVKQGHAKDAAEIGAQALAADRVDDPWRMYGLGLFHALPQHLAAMRSELR